MGKYKNSDVHDKYSDWHWLLTEIDPKYRQLYMADLDRVWIEFDFARNSIVAVIDLKYQGSRDGISPTEKALYEWFEKNGARVYIVFVNQTFTEFRIQNSRGQIKNYSSIEYADWLLSLRTKDYNFFKTA